MTEVFFICVIYCVPVEARVHVPACVGGYKGHERLRLGNLLWLPRSVWLREGEVKAEGCSCSAV